MCITGVCNVQAYQYTYLLGYSGNMACLGMLSKEKFKGNGEKVLDLGVNSINTEDRQGKLFVSLST